MSYSFATTNTGSRYPTDSPYTATVTLAVPSGGVAGDIYLIRVAVTDRGPLTLTGSGFTQLQDTKITPIAGERTDGQYVCYRICDGSEGSTFTVTVSGGAHDFLADCILIHSDAGALTIKSVVSACARLGSLSAGATAAMASASSTAAVGQLEFWLGSLASTGAAYPGSFPSDIITAAVPSGLTERSRVIDDVDEILLSGSHVATSATPVTYGGTATVPFGDDYFGFGCTIIFDVLPPGLIGQSLTASAGTLTPHTSGGSVFATWNPSDKNAQAALSSGNIVMTSTSTTPSKTAAARSTLPITVKTRLQATLTTAAGAGLSLSFGLSDAAVAMNDSFDTGGITNTAGIYTNTGGAAARVYENASNRLWAADAVLSAMTTTTITVDFLIDPATRKCWIRPAGGSTYIGAGDPVAGTTPTFTLGGTGAIYACCADDQGAVVSGKNALFNGDPSGYSGSSVSGYTDGLAQAGTSVALTGQAATSAQGTLAPKLAAAVAGIALATALGTLTPTIKPAMTGQVATTAAGTLTPAIKVPLVGQSLTASGGTLGLPSQVALVGQALATSQGTLSPNIAAPATGMAATASAGTLTPALGAPLVGLSAATATGTLAPSITVPLVGIAATTTQGVMGVANAPSQPLSGISATASAGVLSPAISVPLVGRSATASIGALSPAAVVSAALNGQALTMSGGQLVPAIRVPLVGLSMTATAGRFVDQLPSPPILVSVTVTDIGTRCTTTVTDI